jgi:hypothetical protein
MIELEFDMSVQLTDTEKLSAMLRSIADQIDSGACGSKIIKDGLAGQWRLYDPYEQ